MMRRVITIDEEKCNGCQLCVSACHEGAIGMRNGKAVLLRDDYCDGLGDCLPACPTDAISFEERDTVPYDEQAVQQHLENSHHTGCPGSRIQELKQSPSSSVIAEKVVIENQLRQWPVQIQLVAPNASYFTNANLLIAADCAAYSYANFHQDFMKNKVTLIGCPKLDPVDYSDKLTDILTLNDLRSVTVIRMEVPCCGGIEQATITALKNCDKMIPWQVVTLSIQGEIIE